MTAAVVIAVRGGRAAKSRCAERLGPEQRERLVEAMLADMLQAAAATPAVARTHVTTPTPGLARLAARAGAAVIDEQTLGLNAAFDAARRALAKADPGATLILLPGDLPLLAPADLQAALALAGEGRVVLAPAAEGGTGAIALGAAVEFPFAFGRDSFRRHGEAVRGLGLELAILETPGLGRDVDQPADLEMVLRSAPASRTAGLLRTFEHLPETGT
jgi:2-phospho-L-lactate/phosphoenolpyruvate guanylyltransferase